MTHTLYLHIIHLCLLFSIHFIDGDGAVERWDDDDDNSNATVWKTSEKRNFIVSKLKGFGVGRGAYFQKIVLQKDKRISYKETLLFPPDVEFSTTITIFFVIIIILFSDHITSTVAVSEFTLVM